MIRTGITAIPCVSRDMTPLLMTSTIGLAPPSLDTEIGQKGEPPSGLERSGVFAIALLARWFALQAGRLKPNDHTPRS